ncbi:hypothetical protein ACIRPU_41150 [Streptomyces sp. NPDC102259]|uniref:hypothetical protein n=1 Tax=Streptomyces sp. NPDC102259 TaxID=3366148 RepID=UPI00380B2B99
MMVIESSRPSGSSGSPAENVDRDAAVDELHAAFSRKTEPVVNSLVEAGASDVRLFWINHTIAATISLSPLIKVAGLPEIRYVLLDSRRAIQL